MTAIELLSPEDVQEISSVHGFREWLCRYREENSLRAAVRIRHSHVGLRGHLYCQKHVDCPHVTHFAPDVLGSTIIVTQVGAHSDQDITYRGLPLRQRTVANVAAHETPNRATASLLRAGVQASELPPANVMQSARRKYLRRTNPALNNEVSVTQWLGLIQERAGRPLESLKLSDFIFVPNVRQKSQGWWFSSPKQTLLSSSS